MKKKEYLTIIFLLSVIAVLLAAIASIVFVRKYKIAFTDNVVIVSEEKTEETKEGIREEIQEEVPWTIDSLKEGMVTAIDYTVCENGSINSLSEAEEKLKEYGEIQRKKYDNPRVTEIEKALETEYGIFAVNLGEMDEETARDVEKAVRYMYDTYPELKGTLTNITLANIDSFTTGHLAITDCREYIINGQLTVVPYVMKHEILLGAASFLNRETLLKKCKDGIASGHWMEGTDISALVVHELGHQLLNAYEMMDVGYEHPYYITAENQDAFSYYITDHLKVNQTYAKAVMDKAFIKWAKTNPGQSYEEFCGTISDYAKGLQSDGGISYTETFAEAVVDIYLNGDKATDASKCILEALIKE